MTLKAICDLTEEERLRYRKVAKNLEEKLGSLSTTHLTNVTRVSGYANASYTGTIPAEIEVKLGKPITAFEVSMLCDGGFSHFGGYCNITGDSFTCKIYTD